jgi:hypothetical protein
MRRSQPADYAQHDDEQIRHSRVRAESIATAIAVVVNGKARQVSAMYYGPCYTDPAITAVGHITDVATIVITLTRQPQGG